MEAKDNKKQIPLRITQSLWNELLAWAEEDFRSLNGQIEYILTDSVRRRKRRRKDGDEDGGAGTDLGAGAGAGTGADADD